MSECILIEKKDFVGHVILNRERERNTFTEEFAIELNNSLKLLDDDDEVRVIVIKAKGKIFSTGIDLEKFKGKTPLEYREMIALMNLHNKTIASMKKPVISSVQGFAVANGAGLVLASDFAIAAESAKFGTTAIKVGLICLGPAAPLARHLGRKKLLEMILTGEMISAREAEIMGLVNKVVPDEDLEEETEKFAKKLAALSPLAVQIGKQGIYAMEDMPYEKGIDLSTEMFAALCNTEDSMEGIDAFLGKRKPKWKNR